MTIEGLLNNAREVQQGMQNGTIVRDVLQTH